MFDFDGGGERGKRCPSGAFGEAIKRPERVIRNEQMSLVPTRASASIEDADVNSYLAFRIWEEMCLEDGEEDRDDRDGEDGLRTEQ